MRRGAHDRAPPPQVKAFVSLRSRSRSASSSRRDHADPRGRGVDHVAPGDRQLHREARALRLQRSLTTWTTTSCRVSAARDVLRVVAGARPARRLDARQHDLIDVQEAVLVQADVDERRLQATRTLSTTPCKCCDNRARTAALQVELGHAVSRGPGRRHRAPSLRGAGVPEASSSATRVSRDRR